MDEQSLVGTRRGLHAVAELVLAGPQYAASHDIRLRATPGGFGTCSPPELRVDGLELVAASGRLPLGSTCAELAAAAGLEARDLRDVYAVGPELGAHEPVVLDPEAVALIADAFALGDAALRALAPTQEPVLWPEHFDIAITVDEVNYGVSPGDAHSAVPYAYVGPWSARLGDFWNTSFGAARPMTELPDLASLTAFFAEGAQRAVQDPPRDASPS